MTLVNVGCGAVRHPAWINLDVAPVAPEVRRWDARRGLPFAVASVDAIYHSHLLEHLRPAEAAAFLQECFRVLRPGGLIRVVVPDLEGQARAYLAALDDPAGVDPLVHEWLRLELFDQFERERSGGRIPEFVGRLDAAGLEKLRRRIGPDLDHFAAGAEQPRRSRWTRLRSAGWRGVSGRLHATLVRIGVRLAGGRAMAEALEVGLFRAGGEVHRVAYDRIALRELLGRAGFAEIRVMAAGSSRIPDFAEHGLEVSAGRVRKPDSLFMEAVRPAARAEGAI